MLCLFRRIGAGVLAPIVALIVWSGPLWAADLPPNSDAAHLQEKIRREQEARPKSPLPEPEIEQEAEPSLAPAQPQKAFYLRKIALRGNRTIPTEELAVFAEPFENRTVTLADLMAVAARIEKEYRLRGYVTTLVHLPPQEITDQTATLEVIEGRMGRLHLTGNRWFSQRRIRRHWRLEPGEVFEYKKVVESLNAIHANPDRTARVVLRPGEQTGLTDVHMQIKDRFPGHLRLHTDNHGVRQTGRYAAGAAFEHTDWIIPDSVFTVGAARGREFDMLYGRYVVPLNRRGTRLALSLSRSRVWPSRGVEELGVRGRAGSGSMSLSQPLWDRERSSAEASLGLDAKNNSTRTVQGTVRRERLRALRAGLDLKQKDSLGDTLLTNDLSAGLKIFGASADDNALAGRSGEDPDYFKHELYLRRKLRLTPGTQILLHLRTQLTSSQLPPTEQFFLGGSQGVRGYPESDYLADQAVLIKLEYALACGFIPESLRLPGSRTPLRELIQLVCFVDDGYGKLRHPSHSETPERHLLGAGIGLEVRLSEGAFASVAVGHALGDEPLTESDHTRLHFQIRFES